MKHRVITNLFMSNLGGLSLRQLHNRATRVITPFTAAAVLLDSKTSVSHPWLARCVEMGERAHSLRDAEALRRVGQAIRSLPLGSKLTSIANYYTALSINRRGLDAYPEANRLLVEVVNDGPPTFRAKAMLALGTNLKIGGDRDTAASLFTEARNLAGRCGSGGVHPACILELHRSVLCNEDGDHQGALAVLRGLRPLMQSISSQYPPLLHFYYNDLAVELLETGRIEEAWSLHRVLLNSPFLGMYPEWQRTCADVEARTHRSSQLIVSVTGPVAQLPYNVVEMPSRRNLAAASEDVSEYSAGRERGKVLKFRGSKKHVERPRKRGFIPRPVLGGSDVLRTMTFQQKQAFA
ncbi:MAG TPA: hypothetical protein VI756_12235, partial [Blastocatellia bacterium]